MGMEKGGMEGGKEWCSLTWARCRPCPIMRASCRSQAVVLGAAIVVGRRSFLFLGVRFRRWPFVFIGGRSHSLVGIHFHWWAFVVIGGHSFSLVGGRLRWWAFAFIGGHVFSSVGIRFRWWGVIWSGGKPLVAGWVLPFMGVHLHWWAVISVRARLTSLVAIHDVVAGGVVVRVRRGCYG